VNASFECLLIACMLLSVSTSAAGAGACTARSGTGTPALVELYTSEGCDSCPPADRWFSGLKADAERGNVVPLSFHVDYWDYIGWKDRFAEPMFGIRQREAAARGGAKVVYTPQVFVDGHEFQAWRRTPADKLGSAAAAANAVRPALHLSALPGVAGVQVTVSGTQAATGRRVDAYIAFFENGISSNVTAGENKGVRLQHDFVVRRWLGPFAFDGGKLNVATVIAPPTDAIVAQSGIAVVAYDDRGSVLQALAVPLRACGG
jgi:hypothetical protein